MIQHSICFGKPIDCRWIHVIFWFTRYFSWRFTFFGQLLSHARLLTGPRRFVLISKLRRAFRSGRKRLELRICFWHQEYWWLTSWFYWFSNLSKQFSFTTFWRSHWFPSKLIIDFWVELSFDFIYVFCFFFQKSFWSRAQVKKPSISMTENLLFELTKEVLF